MTEDEKRQELMGSGEKPTADLSVFIPAVEQWIASQDQAATLNHEIEKEEIDLQRETSKKSFRLLLVVVLGVFGISSGIIFYIGDLGAGLLVLSHVGAVVAGLLAGMGFQRTRQKHDE